MPRRSRSRASGGAAGPGAHGHAVGDSRAGLLSARRRRVYFLSAAGALDAVFGIDVVGTMMWAYGVPFHITHGPPLVQSVGYASS